MSFLTARAPRATEVGVCPACNRPFVVPADVIAVLPGGGGYVMELVCTNCDHVQIGRYDEDTMSAFDEHLNETFNRIAREARRMERARVEREIEEFAAALHHGHVLPEDF